MRSDSAILARRTSQLLKKLKLLTPSRRKCSKRSCFDYEKKRNRKRQVDFGGETHLRLYESRRQRPGCSGDQTSPAGRSMSGGREARRSWGNEGGNRATDAGQTPPPPHMTKCY